MKILNAFAGAGGNRHLWDELAEEFEMEFQITAIENFDYCSSNGLRKHKK